MIATNKELSIIKLRDHLLRGLAKKELIHFTCCTNAKYDVKSHHQRYSRVLDKFISGEIKKLMVFMPPQHGKSELCSRRLPAKFLGDNPDLRIALASYNHNFAGKFNKDVQRIITGESYKELYPNTRITEKGIKTNGTWLKNNNEFEIIDHIGSLVSVGVCGGLTGRPVDIGIIDDPYKDAKDAWSPTIRSNIQDWYDTVFTTRLHNNSQQLITLTRWHPDDLAGAILKREAEKWEVIIFPAIKIGEPTQDDPRQEGEALWEERHSLEKLLAIKAQNPHVFESLYQQNPKPKEGLLFPIETLKRFAMSEIEGCISSGSLAVIDLADKGNDYYCMLVAEIFNNKIYIVDCIFTQSDVSVTEPLTISILNRYNVRKCRVESNNGGEIYCRNLKKNCRKEGVSTTFDPKFTTANKETRILLSSGQVKEFLYFRSDYSPNSDYAKFMDNLTGYTMMGKNDHDDGPDGTTMLIEMITESSMKYLFQK